MAHTNCSGREVGTINMANLLVIHADTIGRENSFKGWVLTWDEIQGLINNFKDANFTGRIQNVLNILEVRGELHISRYPAYDHYTAAYLKSDLFWIGSNDEPEIEDELSDWSAMLANEEVIAAAIENATDAELGFETWEPSPIISIENLTVNYYS